MIIQKAGRDVYMQVVAAKKLTGLHSIPDQQIQALSPWGDQKTHKLAATATVDDLMVKISAFNKAVKAADEWFEFATRKG